MEYMSISRDATSVGFGRHGYRAKVGRDTDPRTFTSSLCRVEHHCRIPGRYAVLEEQVVLKPGALIARLVQDPLPQHAVFVEGTPNGW